MAAHAIWKGRLDVDGWKLPVKLYAAFKDRSVHFHLLDPFARIRIKQRMINPETGEEVPKAEIQKGLELEPGSFVILRDDELKQLRPESNRNIEVTRFVPAARVHSQWYERPYYLGPDGDSARYFGLAAALAQRKRCGIARWVMHNKQYVGALVARDGYICLLALRHPEEVLSARELPSPGGRAPDARELRMAEQLVAALEGDFHAEDFRDQYRERVLAFIKKKASGRKPRLVAVKSKKPADSLAEQLSKSLRAHEAQKRKTVA